MDTPIRVLIVAPDASLRNGICAALGNPTNFSIVGTWADLSAAVESVPQLQPHVIIWDVDPHMLVESQTVSFLCNLNPESRVLALCPSNREYLMLESLRQGIWGYQIKDENFFGEIAKAVQTIYYGGAVVGSKVAGWIIDEVSRHPEKTNAPAQECKAMDENSSAS
jgi:DNA-binding NarL/FixJ family response regulator